MRGIESKEDLVLLLFSFTIGSKIAPKKIARLALDSGLLGEQLEYLRERLNDITQAISRERRVKDQKKCLRNSFLQKKSPKFHEDFAHQITSLVRA